MKLELSFSTILFDYQVPVTVGKKQLAKNTALRVFEKGMFLVDLTTLPGFHSYDLRQWAFVLEMFFSQHELSFDRVDFNRPFFGLCLEERLEAELTYALEAVLFAYLALHRPHLLGTHQQTIKVNALYSSAYPLDQGTEVLKIKIRPGKEEEAIVAIQNALQLNPSMRFRFDGNRSFDIEGLLIFLETLKKKTPEIFFFAQVQYIEEPFLKPSDNALFKKLSPIALALDESLPHFLPDLSRFEQEFFILKPSLLGLSVCHQLLSLYPQRAIVSSSYETPSAMQALIYLAGKNPDQYHGLDTLKFIPKCLGT